MQSKPIKDKTHSWSVANFETERKSLTGFIRNRVLPLLDARSCRRILIRAPVKSGKREMVEYLAVRDLKNEPSRVHAFVSAFHRTADADQRQELGEHNLEVFSLRTKEIADACCKWISQKIKSKKQVVIHIDECDFGSGQKQILAQVYRTVRNDERITCVLYSATPEEVLFSGEVLEEEKEEEGIEEMLDDFAEGERINYEPPISFCGPKTFLAANLVKDAKPFFYFRNNILTLSEQGKQILADLKRSTAKGKGRNILVLRLSYSDLRKGRTEMKDKKSIYQFVKHCDTVPELEDCIVVSENEAGTASNLVREEIHWSNRKYWDGKFDFNTPHIVVIDQTSSRSTEWACHDRIFAYHDFRNRAIFSTISQAQERVNHYNTKYPGGFQPIQVYGHLKTFLLSAGKIDYKQYCHHEWRKWKVHKQDLYKIVDTKTHTLHPEYPKPMTLEEADEVLMELSCYMETMVSSRVRGTVKTSPVIHAEFFECDKKSFEKLQPKLVSLCGGIREFQNPFKRSEKQGLSAEGLWKGYLRDWNVYDFEEDIASKPGWGFSKTDLKPRLTICYSEGKLGVALRYHIEGEIASVSTLTTHGSMYKTN